MEVNKSSRGRRGFKVAPLSTENIRSTVIDIRKILSVPKGWVDIIRIYEFQLAQLGIVYDYCDENEMQVNHGLTIPDENTIKIREDVLEGAENNSGRDRFTLCHEFGHLVLHAGVSFARKERSVNHKPYEDSEWQADTFAAEFMMPVEEVQQYCSGPDEIVSRFGVSEQAADIRWENLKKKGFIK